MESASVFVFSSSSSDTDDTAAVFRIAQLHATSSAVTHTKRSPAHRLLRGFSPFTEFCQMQILSVVCFFHTVNNCPRLRQRPASFAYKRIDAKTGFPSGSSGGSSHLRPYFVIQIPVFSSTSAPFESLFHRSTPSRDGCKVHGSLVSPRRSRTWPSTGIRK